MRRICNCGFFLAVKYIKSSTYKIITSLRTTRFQFHIPILLEVFLETIQTL